MGRVHLVGGEKGGVGKSVVARLLAQYWIDRGASWTGFDTDVSHADFRRHYSEYVSAIDPGENAGLDRIVEALEVPYREIVVDLATGTQATLEHWMRSSRLNDYLAPRGHWLWHWFVIDNGKSSLRLLYALLDRMHSQDRIVCVINHGCAQHFMLFEDSGLREEIEQRGGHVIKIGRLDPACMHEIDVTDKSFWAAIHNDDPSQGPCLTSMQRQRTRGFVETSHATFDKVTTPTA